MEDTPDDEELGYILEVDLEYPPELHDLHNDYPLAPEKMQITPEMLSPYSQQLAKDLEYSPGKVEKLIPNLWNKTKYILHYRKLKFYLEQGMTLTKIYRGLMFIEKPWLKPYIDLNTRMRPETNTKFEKNFFKLMNDSVFGKTMEDIGKRVNVKLMSEKADFKKWTARGAYKNSKVFISDDVKEEYFAALNMMKATVRLEKPTFLCPGTFQTVDV